MILELVLSSTFSLCWAIGWEDRLLLIFDVCLVGNLSNGTVLIFLWGILGWLVLSRCKYDDFLRLILLIGCLIISVYLTVEELILEVWILLEYPIGLCLEVPRLSTSLLYKALPILFVLLICLRFR